MQSPSQKRRATAAQPAAAQPIPAPVAAPDDLLDDLLADLDSADDWAPEASGVAVRVAKADLPPIAWDEQTVTLAAAAGVTLPPTPPRDRPAGIPGPDRWLLVAAPADLESLNRPIPTAPERAKGAAPLLYSLMHGRYSDKSGRIITLPSMADGQGLPLVALLKILSKAPELTAKVGYLQRLIGKGRHNILSNLADKSGRFAYLSADGKLYLTAEPFA